MKSLLDWINRYIDCDPLDHPLLKFSQGRLWTLRNAFEGTLILGSNGSGKTSGSGCRIATAMLQQGFAGLVLCVKPDEADLWEKLCRGSGRTSDLIRVHSGSPYCYNPLEFEKDILNQVELLTNLAAPGSQSNTDSPDSFWDTEAKKLLHHLISLARAVGSGADFIAFRSILESLPDSEADCRSSEWVRGSACGRALQLAGQSHDQYVRETVAYFRRELPNTPDKQRAGYISIVSSLLSTLLDEAIRDLFAHPSTITPEKVIANGNIVVVDIPVETRHKLGRFANMIWKICFQRAVAARKGNSPECFLWADEAQFLLSKGDAIFQTTARSKGCASVFLSQNYSGLKATLGQNIADQIAGVLKTKIFHQNDCPVTNEWASKIIGSRRQLEESETVSASSPASISRTSRTVDLPKVRPEQFLQLKTGGPANGRQVTGYVAYPVGPTNETRCRREIFHQK